MLNYQKTHKFHAKSTEIPRKIIEKFGRNFCGPWNFRRFFCGILLKLFLKNYLIIKKIQKIPREIYGKSMKFLVGISVVRGITAKFSSIFTRILVNLFLKIINFFFKFTKLHRKSTEISRKIHENSGLFFRGP